MLPHAPLILPNNRARLPWICFKLVHSLQPALRRFHFHPTHLIILLLVLNAVVLTACTPQDIANPAEPWVINDLHTLSPTSIDSSPGDLIAAYSRIAGSDLQLRFDFLDMQGYLENDYYIAMDYQPGGTYELPLQGAAEIAWDSLLVLPALGRPQWIVSPAASGAGPATVSTSLENPAPRIIRLPWQDYIQVSINRFFLPAQPKEIQVQAFSTLPGTLGIRDTIGPFSTQDSVSQQAPLLLTFWDIFPAFSPAQSLRKWDGAHTGPYGERHGLALLLINIERYGVPAVLLDLRTPPTLSALDHLQVLPLVRELLNRKLLTLPDVLPGSPSFPIFPLGLPDGAAQVYLDRANQVSEDFGIPASDLLYTPGTLAVHPPGYSQYFIASNQALDGENLIPLPPQETREPQVSTGGLSLAIRKQLLNNAIEWNLNPGSYPLLVLGGSFQESAFGDPAASAASLSYIAAHPWIKPLNRQDLQLLPRKVYFQYLPGTTRVSNVDQFLPSPVLGSFPEPGSSSSGTLLQEAWDSAFSLYYALPPVPDTLVQLRANYSGQPGIILAASDWEAESYTTNSCTFDLDWDGFPECILASNEQFAVIDPLGARLLAYFYRDKSGVHQVIAPSHQFIAGLSDPSAWDLEAGEGADPAGIHGAFADAAPPWSVYSEMASEKGFTFTSPDLQIEKTYSLEQEGLAMSYKIQGPTSGLIPFAIDPWQRFSPGWSDLSSYSPLENGYQVSLGNEVIVDIIADIPLQAISFTDSQNSLGMPEDPNFDYPPGHYLPYPLVDLEYHALGDFTIQIQPVHLP